MDKETEAERRTLSQVTGLQDKLNFNPGNLTPGLVPLPPIPKCLIKVSYYSYFKKTEKGGEKRGREEKTEGKYRSSFFIIFSC